MPRETKQVCRAIHVLTKQFYDAQAANANDLGAMALESAGLTAEDGWRFNLQMCQLERDVPEEPQS